MMQLRTLAPPLLAGLLLMAMTATAVAGPRPFPDEIPLPDGFAPEGIATGRGTTFYTGSLSGAGIWTGDYQTGAGHLLVEGGGPYVGMDVDARNRLWVAGGPTGTGTVFDADTGATLATFTFAASSTFVNDVIVTQDAAYFTDSFQPTLYRVPIGPGGTIGAPSPMPLDPDDIGFVAGAFNLNGIEATPSGDALIVVNSSAGTLYRIEPASGVASPIDLGGAAVPAGDGILLSGRTLYVVQNQFNQVAVVELAPDLGSGTIARTLSSTGFDVPTTVARSGSSLYVVNARFGTPVTPETPYWVTRLDR
jgi:sugar lactone lactonase YvrE